MTREEIYEKRNQIISERIAKGKELERRYPSGYGPVKPTILTPVRYFFRWVGRLFEKNNIDSKRLAIYKRHHDNQMSDIREQHRLYKEGIY